MYRVTKRIEVAGSHRLNLTYASKCSKIHGHNWIIHVTCEAQILNQNGMVIDFSDIKRIVNQLDHAHLNEVVPFNPTAEHIARWLCEQIEGCVEVTVQESEGNVACYTL